MKRKGMGMLLFLLVILALTSCSANAGEDTANGPGDSLPASIKENSETENREDNRVKREFCKVESVQEEYFTLKNTAGELYCIDNSFLGEFKAGDAVLLLYLERNPAGDGTYSADVHAIYPDDDTLLYPANETGGCRR